MKPGSDPDRTRALALEMSRFPGDSVAMSEAIEFLSKHLKSRALEFFGLHPVAGLRSPCLPAGFSNRPRFLRKHSLWDLPEGIRLPMS